MSNKKTQSTIDALIADLATHLKFVAEQDYTAAQKLEYCKGYINTFLEDATIRNTGN
jgi:hypothetical protein